MVEKCDCDCIKWSLTKAVLNRYTLENKLYGLQLYIDRYNLAIDVEKPFSEHFVSDTAPSREFALKN